MKTYAVTAVLDGKFWFVRIPEIDGATQALTREDIPRMARDFIAVTLDVPADSFEISLDPWHSEPLPNGVDRIVDYLARMARGYNNHLKWNEQEKLKADLMNEPDRWLVITPEQFRARAESAGMRPEDADLITDYLRRRKQGRRLIPKASYREFKFGYEVDTLP